LHQVGPTSEDWQHPVVRPASMHRPRRKYQCRLERPRGGTEPGFVFHLQRLNLRRASIRPANTAKTSLDSEVSPRAAMSQTSSLSPGLQGDTRSESQATESYGHATTKAPSAIQWE